MPAELIDGVGIARAIREEVARDSRALAARGIKPGIAVVMVGADPASSVYVRAKAKASAEAEMHSVVIALSADVSEHELLATVHKLNADPTIHGILIQLPLPSHIDTNAVIRAVDPSKDVDGFHPVNMGKLLIGERDGFTPCTPAGIQVLLRRANVVTRGMDCVIVGRSNIVGKPMAALMMQDSETANCTVTVCHRHTSDLASHTRRADILIVATGRPRTVTGEMIKHGAVVIDVGVNRVSDASASRGFRLVGDVDFDSARTVASRITPVPGGVGPMTIAMLLSNTLLSASRQ